MIRKTAPALVGASALVAFGVFGATASASGGTPQGTPTYSHSCEPQDHEQLCTHPSGPPTTSHPGPCDHPTLTRDAAVLPTCPPTTPHPCVTITIVRDASVRPTCPPSTPPPHPCGTPTLVKDELVHPTCPPSTTPSTTPSTSPSSVPSTTPSVTPTTPKPTTPVASATTPSTPTLAHTGASVVPFAVGAAVLGAAGGGLVLYTRKQRAGIR